MSNTQENPKQEFNLNDFDPAPREAIREIMARHSRERVRCAQAGTAPPATLSAGVVINAVSTAMVRFEGQSPTINEIVTAADGILNPVAPVAVNDNVEVAAPEAVNDNTRPEADDKLIEIDDERQAQHDKEMARLQLSILDPNATKFTFQTFSDNKNATAAEKARATRIIHGTLDEVWPQILAVNTVESQVGVFVTVNETDLKGRKAENIVRARALVGDADSAASVAQAAKVFAETGAEPSMIVRTGAGCHVYHLVEDDLPLDQYRPLQEQFNAKLGTDPAVKDLPRVLRLAGTLHLKNAAKPRLIRLVNKPGDPVRR